jgi:hypothetical protein
LAIAAQQYTKKVEIPKEYQKFAKVFSEEEAKRFPPRRSCDHAIELKPGAPDAIECKIYPMTRVEDEALDVFINEQLEKGYIHPSKSQYASSFFFIKKKDGKLRPVQDYRKVNAWTVRNQYPLPLIRDLIRDLGGAVIFTKFDIRQGYNNIRIKEGDEHKAAFKTRRGLFEPTVMYFGLCNSPATFQAFMNDIFRPAIAKHDTLGMAIHVYMDDIAVATKVSLSPAQSHAAHVAAVTDVLQVALDNDLYFKPKKCVFHATSIDYLGVILEKGVTRMDPVKISGINDWPTPKTVKDVRSFLGFCNFYRPFIRGFATVAHPLNELTRKDAPWTWETRQQQVFATLKHQVTSEPILAQPVLSDQFDLEVDASGFAVGAVLLQKKEDGKRHPVGYYSATLNEAERNYDIYNLELLAIVKALRNWRPLLAGSPHDIRIFSDHMNLQYWCDPQKISRRVARKFLKLQEFPIKIHQIKGKTNGRANALSRRPDYNQGEHDNADVTVLPDKLFIRSLIEIGAEHDEQDESTLTKWVDAHKLKKIGEIWYKNGRRVVTNVGSGTRAVIAAHHDAPVHGHPGIARTIQLVEQDSWWPGLRREVTDYVKGCTECQRHKVNNRPTKAPLEPIWAKPEAMPFETVAVDFITKLPVSQGYDSILTVTDHDCSKATIFIPCVEEISGEETAALYAKHIFARYGLPTKIISDQDLCKRLGIQQNISTAYHPRTDGQSERSNQWLEQYLRFWVNERQNDWAQYLPLAEFAHNNWPNESTRESPFHILMGYHPRADYSGTPSNIPRVNTRLEQYNEARHKAQDLMRWVQQSWVQHCDTPKYKTRDQVWLEGRHLRTSQPTTKLAPKCHGPFEVIQVMSPVNYRLRLPTQWSIHDIFHTDLLTPYRETPTHGANYQRPPPDLVDGVEEYEVERVLDSRRHGRGRKLQYLIAWKGYPDSDNQWVNWDDAEGAEDAIREFKRSNSDREIHIKASIDSSCSLSHSRISSMSTSPASTCHFTIDTPENCAAWDAVVRSDSYSTPAVTYGDNNNVDDATTYNDYRRGRRSPGLASNILDATAAIRTVEGPTTSLPSSTLDIQRNETIGRPPLLEDGGARVVGRLPLLGLCPTGMQASAAGQSAGNTPYPNAAILFESGNNEDDDIKCGQCENPIAYCHCSPTMLPPRINVDKENDKEAKVSTPEGSDKENRPVEVRISRGVGGEADERGRVQTSVAAASSWCFLPF